MIVQYGSTNTTSQVVPGVLTQILSPKVKNLNGVPTNVVGVVGTATFGPKNTPITVGNYTDFQRVFGSLQARKYDLGTQLAVMVQQGANAFTCVRVTDGTDTAATKVVLSTCITLTAKYTGSQGNNIVLTISTGSKAGSWKAVVAIPGLGVDEVFDNIVGSANAFWVALAAALNTGTPMRGPSGLVTAAAGVGTTAVSAASYQLTGGTDGASTIDATVLLGADTASRTGMYALRGTHSTIGLLADCDAATAWSAQAAFGLAEGIYMIVPTASGTSIATAISGKATAGIDNFPVKVMHGDWLYWADPVNGGVRLVSPAAFAAGRLSNLSPEGSSLNKQLFAILGSEKTGNLAGSSANYSRAELQDLFIAGIDVIGTPAPGGSFWTVLGGINSSSSADVNGDNYTRMINYLARTLDKGMGVYVGEVINNDTFRSVRSTLETFLGNLLNQGVLARQEDGSLPFSVVCDASNNPRERTMLGYLQADIEVRFQAITKVLIVNAQGGQTVSITVQ